MQFGNNLEIINECRPVSKKELPTLLQSRLFRDNKNLQAALIHDSSHVTPGSQGQQVRLIQRALIYLGYQSIAGQEYARAFYGQTTTDAVLRFKTTRRIINYAYQRTPDNIVGKMTIRQLDLEMMRFEATSAA